MKLGRSPTISTVNASFAEDVAAYADGGLRRDRALGVQAARRRRGERRAARASTGSRCRTASRPCPSFLQLAIPGMEGPADPERAHRGDLRVDPTSRCLRPGVRALPERAARRPVPGARAATSSSTGCAVPRRRPARQESASASSRSTRLSAKPRVSSRRSPTRSRCSTRPAPTTSGSWPIRSTSATKPTRPSSARRRASRGSTSPTSYPSRHRASAACPGRRVDQRRSWPRFGRTGWDGTLDVEIFSTPDSFWALPADEAARRAYAAASALA